MKRHAKLTIRIIFFAIAIIGFLVQIMLITTEYFSYLTTSSIETITVESTRAPGISLCVPFREMINIDLLGKGFAQNGLKNDTTNEFNIESLLTLAEIFKYTPEVPLSGCRIRWPRKFHVETYNASHCNHWFTRKKLVSEEYVCYKYQLFDDGLYDFKTTAKAFNYQGLTYQIIIDRQHFERASFILPRLHDNALVGSISKMYSRTYISILTGLNFGRISDATYKTSLLPSPYVTHCVKQYQQICLKSCSIRLSLNAFNKLPYSEIYTQDDIEEFSFDKKLISPWFLKSDDNSMKFRNISKTCEDQCPRSCEQEFRITYIITVAKLDHIDGFSFRVDLTQWPVTHIRHSPNMDFNEYIIYIMSCMGAWLGLSFINLNPFNRRTNLRNRKLCNEVKTMKLMLFRMNLSLKIQGGDR